MESVGNSLPEVITTVLEQWRSIAKPRQRELLRICTKKYNELERVHENFLGIMNELYEVLMDASFNNRPVDRKLVEEIWAFEERRRVGRAARHAAYLEAQIYAEAQPRRLAGIVKTVPPAVESAVKKFMNSYMSYFEHEGVYDHEVARGIRNAVGTLDSVVRTKRTMGHGDEVAASMRFIANLRDALDLSWMKVSRDYYRLYSTFLDHGVILE